MPFAAKVLLVPTSPTRTRSTDGKRRYPSNVIGDLGEEHAPYFFAPKVTPEERDRHLPRGMHNTHHAVKPIELLRWLIRLVTPTAGTVLDPFAGSGSTGCACTREGMSFIGIE